MSNEIYYFVGIVLNRDLSEIAEQRIVEAWNAAGLTRISSLDCSGVGLDKANFRQDDLPIFLSLSNLLTTESAEQRFIFTIVQGEPALQQTLQLAKKTAGGGQGENGFIFAHPLLTVIPI